MILKQQYKVTSTIKTVSNYFSKILILNSFYIGLSFILTTKTDKLVAKSTKYHTLLEIYSARNQIVDGC